jgi:TolB protein
MLVSLYRLADRLGRVVVKSGLKVGESVSWAAGRGRRRPARPTAARLAALRNANAASAASAPDDDGPRPLVSIALTPRQIPAVVLLLLIGIGLVAASTLMVQRMVQPTPVVAALFTFAPPPVTRPAETPTLTAEPVVAENVGPIEIDVTPQAADVGPTVTAPPNPLSLGGTLYFAYRTSGYTNLWAQVLGRTDLVRLTAGPWDDRDPAISPDGRQLAFASRREGAWNLYVLDLTDGALRKLTDGPEFKGNPYWSPDGQFLVFEIYRNDNLDIAVVSARGGEYIPLTADPAADYEPAWSPAGREIVWVSMRTGNPDLWRLSLDNPDERTYTQLTDTPFMQESDPTYSPAGDNVVYSDAASTIGLVYAHSATDPTGLAYEVGQGLHPTWSPEGSSLATVVVQEGGQDYILAAPLGQAGLAQIAYRATAGRIRGVSWSGTNLPDPLPEPLMLGRQVSDAALWTEVLTTTETIAPYALVPLDNVLAADPRLSDRVDEAFTGLRNVTARAVGWDFLLQLDNALVALDAPPPPSQDYSSWLKTGRAFDVARAAQDYGWVKITREDYGFRAYWRVWLLAAVQDGSLGEPLRRPPWNLAARYSGRPEPYDAGGEWFNVMPPGYFVDFTALAEDYGWTRVPAESNWRLFYPGILYWRFEHRDGLDWLSAMREVYTAAEVATQTPVPSPTNTPTITNTPTRTITPTRTPSRTPTATSTRRPTITPTPSATRWPTITPTPSHTPRPTATPTGTWYTETPTPTPSVPPTSTALAEDQVGP